MAVRRSDITSAYLLQSWAFSRIRLLGYLHQRRDFAVVCRITCHKMTPPPIIREFLTGSVAVLLVDELSQIDLPFYRFGTEEVTLFLCAGRLVDDRIERLFQAFDKHIEEKLRGSVLTEPQKLVLAFGTIAAMPETSKSSMFFTGRFGAPSTSSRRSGS